MSTYIKFELDEKQNPKTKIWNILTKDNDVYLGQIRWYGAWRCYGFYPEKETIFEKICLRNIADFCETETRKHREK